tara:strand:- start:373 stop:627 length:255 start_codon:yes stop_codon:yes gene_type:complete
VKLERIKEEIATLRAALILAAASALSILGWLFSHYDTARIAELATAIYALLITVIAAILIVRSLFRGFEKLEDSDDLDSNRRDH